MAADKPLREPTVLDAGLIPVAPPEPELLPAPVILRCVEKPNHKILQIKKERLPDGRWRVTPYPPIAFINTYLRVTRRDHYEAVTKRLKGLVFEEPSDESHPVLQYFDAKGRPIFKTRNPQLFEVFARKMAS